jgi:hypothetical protein
VFSTYLYTGNGSTQTITNGIDLSGKGGLVWLKSRSNAYAHCLYDTVRGPNQDLHSNSTQASGAISGGLTAFGATGFSLDSSNAVNQNAATYASWTFREQPKFFDVVTYTGNGANYRTINHSLGSTPGCVIVKSTSTTGSWAVYHTGSNPNNLILNSTSGAITGQFSIQDVSAASFGVADSSFYGFPQSIPVNDSGQTYVAYLFAHNAGGFGLTGTDNVISCGSFTTDGSGNATVNLGYEPQWFLRKETSSANDWVIFDNMRGWSLSDDAFLYPNSSSAELSADRGNPTATGFTLTGQNASATFIYIAIRRGPMKVPTDATKVFALDSTTTSANKTITTGFPSDSSLATLTSSGVGPGRYFWDRLRGSTTSLGNFLRVTSTNGEATSGFGWGFDKNTSVIDNFFFDNFGSSYNTIYYNFRRAPTYFDEVCYTGNGVVGQTYTHNLAAVPQLLIVKRRDTTGAWITLYQPSMLSGDLGSTAAFSSGSVRFEFGNDVVGISPTATQFTVSPNGGTNTSAATYIAYLFATCAGVSKVGSYTGTGALQTVDCGFTSGARFVLIKRRDSTGDWYVWDSARGITGGDDPYLLLNTTADETTGTNYVDTVASGFKVTAAAPAAINASGGSYIFLAIA